jgi:hypothetical protein
LVEKKAGSYLNYTGKDVWQDEQMWIYMNTQNVFSRELYLNVSTRSGTPLRYRLVFEVFENVELPNYINFKPTFVYTPSNHRFEFSSGDENVPLSYDIQLPRPSDDKAMLETVRF